MKICPVGLLNPVQNAAGASVTYMLGKVNTRMKWASGYARYIILGKMPFTNAAPYETQKFIRAACGKIVKAYMEKFLEEYGKHEKAEDKIKFVKDFLSNLIDKVASKLGDETFKNEFKMDKEEMKKRIEVAELKKRTVLIKFGNEILPIQAWFVRLLVPVVVKLAGGDYNANLDRITLDKEAVKPKRIAPRTPGSADEHYREILGKHREKIEEVVKLREELFKKE